MKDPLQIEVVAYSMRVNTLLGSLYKNKLYEALLDNKTVSEQAFESVYKNIIEYDWRLYQNKIMGMILVTKGTPLVMLSALMLKQSKAVVKLNLISSVLQLSYECF